jgi:hypothetical protein
VVLVRDFVVAFHKLTLLVSQLRHVLRLLSGLNFQVVLGATVGGRPHTEHDQYTISEPQIQSLRLWVEPHAARCHFGELLKIGLRLLCLRVHLSESDQCWQWDRMLFRH